MERRLESAEWHTIFFPRVIAGEEIKMVQVVFRRSAGRRQGNMLMRPYLAPKT